MPRMNKLSAYRTTVAPAADGGTVITYVSTPIVHIHPDKSVTLNSGGYRTVTTKRKMNQAARQFDLGYGVFQRDFDWFVSRWSNEHGKWGGEVPFVDGMTLRQFGRAL